MFCSEASGNTACAGYSITVGQEGPPAKCTMCKTTSFGAGQLAIFERSAADDGPGRLVASAWSIRLDALEQLTHASARGVRHSAVLALHSPAGGTWLVVSTQARGVAVDRQ